MIDLQELLTRGVDTIYPSREKLEEKLLSGEKITLYLGVDPTGSLLHIGHTVALRKLAQFQKAGHKVILLIGDFTGRIGDPTGKDKTRVPLTANDVLKNAETYKEQAALVLDFEDHENPVEIKYNSEWLSKLSFEEVVKLAANFTVQQMVERDMFSNRIKDGKPISLHEFFYPLMQGYDSVAMDVDLEIGGTDQTFNMLAGRTLQRKLNDREKFVVAVPLITDSNGVKIGKSEGNAIAITGQPAELYGQIMSLGDDVIVPILTTCTDVLLSEIAEIEQAMLAGENPRDYKMRLAREVVTLYNDEAAANAAEEEFKAIFADGGKPTEIPTVPVPVPADGASVIVGLGMSSSKSDARRLFEQGGIKVNDEKVEDGQAELILKSGDVVQVGKRKFIQIQ